MAGGEGGFSTKPMGFDKNEVNDYIAKINREMKELRADKEANDEKTRVALKKADEADAKIKAAKAEGDKKAAELELQLKTEQKNAENLIAQIDDLKLKLKAKTSQSAGNAKAAEQQAAQIVAKANATAADIVAKANATAKDTVEKAKKTAQQMVNSASGAGGADPAAVNELLEVINKFVSSVTSGANELKTKANGLLSAEKSDRPAVTVPDFSDIKAPQAEAPVAQSAPKAAAKSGDDDIFAALEDDSAEVTEETEELEMVTEIQPLDDPANAPGAVVLDEFDLSQPMSIDELDEPVDEVKPISTKKRGAADLSDEFEKQILAQSTNNAALRAEMDEDMLAAVKQQEELFAVKPSDDNIADFDMDAPSDDVTTMDDLLKQAELAFGGASVDESSDNDYTEQEDTSSKGGGDNMWAELQNELWAMEKTGNLGGSDDSGSDAGASSFDDRATPDTDNSDIWDLGFGDEETSGGDDDMSMGSDIFGSL